MQFTGIIKKAGVLPLLALTLALGLTACSKAPAQAAESVSQSAVQQTAESASQPDPQQTAEPAAQPTSQQAAESGDVQPQAGQIYLYGEQHADEKILNREVEIWNDHYHNHNMRHLFVELPYYTAEYLNLWMKSDSDEILNALYDDWRAQPRIIHISSRSIRRLKASAPRPCSTEPTWDTSIFQPESAIWNI